MKRFFSYAFHCQTAWRALAIFTVLTLLLSASGSAAFAKSEETAKPAVAIAKPAATITTPVLISPTGGTADGQPTYSWNAVSGATAYLFFVYNGTTNYYTKWYTAAEANCSTTCWLKPAALPGTGSYYWWVQAKNNYEYSAWSNGLSFVYGSVTIPAAPVITTPSGYTTATTPAYVWAPSTGATDYLLLVFNGASNVWVQWYSTGQAACNSAQCTVTPPIALATGTYYWWVLARSAGGNSPWSTGKTFIVSSTSITVPGAPTPVSPTGAAGTTTPTFTWNVPSTGSTPSRYFFYVDGPGSTLASATGTNLYARWYTSTELSCTAYTCTITPSSALATGTYYWWVLAANDAGEGVYSDVSASLPTEQKIGQLYRGMRFQVGVVTGPNPPTSLTVNSTAATTTAPGPTITNTTPTLAWNSGVSTDVVYYRIQIDNVTDSTNFLAATYVNAAAYCNSSTCQYIAPSTMTAAKTYSVSLWSWNRNGLSGAPYVAYFTTP